MMKYHNNNNNNYKIKQPLIKVKLMQLTKMMQ